MKFILFLVTFLVLSQAFPIEDLPISQRKTWAMNTFKLISEALKESVKNLPNQEPIKKTSPDHQIQEIEITPFAAFYPIERTRSHFESDLLANIQALAQETLNAQINKRLENMESFEL